MQSCLSKCVNCQMYMLHVVRQKTQFFLLFFISSFSMCCFDIHYIALSHRLISYYFVAQLFWPILDCIDVTKKTLYKKSINLQMTVNFNQKKKTMFITPATKKNQKQKTTEPAFYTYHTDSVNLAASMKLEFFFLAN